MEGRESRKMLANDLRDVINKKLETRRIWRDRRSPPDLLRDAIRIGDVSIPSFQKR